jgi:hypothetical protein
MLRIMVVFAASIIAFATFTSGVDAKGPAARQTVKAAKGFVAGTKENSVTLTDTDSSGSRGNITPLRGNSVKSLLPATAGRATTPVKPAPIGGIVRPRPTPQSRAATAKVLNNILPQAISAGTQIINRIKERDGEFDEDARSILPNRVRRARDPLFEPMLPQLNVTGRTYETGNEEPSSVLDGETPPVIQQTADDNNVQSNTPTEALQMPADTGPVQPPIANTASNPAGGAKQSLAELLATDDTRMFQHYMENYARNTTKFNDAIKQYNDEMSLNLRLNHIKSDQVISKYHIIREQYYIDQIAALRQLEESVQYADFAKQRIDNLKKEFKQEQETFNQYMQNILER